MLIPGFLSATLRRGAATLGALRRDRRGNVLMIFGFAAVPLTFATGMAIDYSSAMRLETQLGAVADAATLAAVTTPMMKQSLPEACRAARAAFTSQMNGMTGLMLDPTDANALKVTITDTLPSRALSTVTCGATGVVLPAAALPLSRTATAVFSGQSRNTFASVLGIPSLTVNGTSSAKTTLAPYIDIHLALDTSQSMGLAATDQAAKDLWYWTGRLNGRSCQFGCHARDPKERYANEDIANAYNIPLRVDVLRQATLDMIDTAVAAQGTNRTYQFGLYRIGKNAGRYATGIDEYARLTTDLASVRSKVSTLSLSANDGAVGFGDTDLPTTTNFILPYIKATSATYDDGTSQARARKFFFMVTDGVTDVEGNCTYGHCTKPIDPTTCDAYKNKGITVGIVYTTYLPTKADPTNPSSTALRDEYIKLIQPIASKIEPSLRACATTGWFFEASDQASIHSAMQALFRQAIQTPTIIR